MLKSIFKIKALIKSFKVVIKGIKEEVKKRKVSSIIL
jgi:hypothetical protein